MKLLTEQIFVQIDGDRFSLLYGQFVVQYNGTVNVIFGCFNRNLTIDDATISVF